MDVCYCEMFMAELRDRGVPTELASPVDLEALEENP